MYNQTMHLSHEVKLLLQNVQDSPRKDPSWCCDMMNHEYLTHVLCLATALVLLDLAFFYERALTDITYRLRYLSCSLGSLRCS